jgi:hypothetical protein
MDDWQWKYAPVNTDHRCLFTMMRVAVVATLVVALSLAQLVHCVPPLAPGKEAVAAVRAYVYYAEPFENCRASFLGAPGLVACIANVAVTYGLSTTPVSMSEFAGNALLDTPDPVWDQYTWGFNPSDTRVINDIKWTVRILFGLLVNSQPPCNTRDARDLSGDPSIFVSQRLYPSTGTLRDRSSQCIADELCVPRPTDTNAVAVSLSPEQLATCARVAHEEQLYATRLKYDALFSEQQSKRVAAAREHAQKQLDTCYLVTSNRERCETPTARRVLQCIYPATVACMQLDTESDRYVEECWCIVTSTV